MTADPGPLSDDQGSQADADSVGKGAEDSPRNPLESSPEESVSSVTDLKEDEKVMDANAKAATAHLTKNVVITPRELLPEDSSTTSPPLEAASQPADPSTPAHMKGLPDTPPSRRADHE